MAVEDLASLAGVSLSNPWAWIPVDGAPCSLPVNASEGEWAESDAAFFGFGADGSACEGCPFNAVNAADGVGPCAAAAIGDRDGVGLWFGVFGGLTPSERAVVADDWGVAVPEYVEGGVEARDGRHGSSEVWGRCRCSVCREARSAWRRANERSERSREQADAWNAAKRARYAELREQGLSRDEARRIA